MKQSFYRIFFLGFGICSFGVSWSQKDSTGKGAIDITSTFKPVLKQAAKINFNATPPAPDTAKSKLKYDIPDQNLLFAYQPGSLKPLALSMDTAGKFDNNSYVKIGFGSLRTPYAQAGISFGDGKTAGLNIYAKHVASESKREFQKFSNTDVKLSGFFTSGNNLEWNASIAMLQDKTYKYGFLPATLSFPTDSLKQNFQTVAGRLALHNINKTAFGLTYSPEVKIDVFSDNLKNTESNTVLSLPLQKTVGKVFAVNLGITFDLTRLSPKGKTAALDNTMYYLSPSLYFKTPKINGQVGIRPSWDNGKFKMFPNVLADILTPDKRFTFQLGWTGYVRKTTYQYLASQNPWLWLPSTLKNTWVEERFAGFKGSVGSHFSYSAKVAYNKLSNQPLFINDTTSGYGGKSFRVVNEPEMKVVNFGGQLGYAIHEKFSIITDLAFNQYTLKANAEPWGFSSLEFNTAMRLQIIKDLWLKGDLFAWNGRHYMKKDGSPGKLPGATDLNAGLEFKITKSLNLWTQFNNIFNKEYQRWNQYPVYGFNFVGGIVFSFDQKN